jgi:hypothetical protein
MRIGVLASSGVYAALVEEGLQECAGGRLQVVWTVEAPDSVLAVLDHNPEAFLLDMRWRERAMVAGQILLQAGLLEIVCLFDRLDDPLIPLARAYGFSVLGRTSPWKALAEHLLTRV